MDMWPLYLLCLFLGYCAGRYFEKKRSASEPPELPENEDEMPLKSTQLSEPSEVSGLREQLRKEQETTRVGVP